MVIIGGSSLEEFATILQAIHVTQLLQLLQLTQSEMPDEGKARTSVETMDLIRRA